MIPDAHFQSVLEIWSELQERTVTRLMGNSMAPLLRDGDRLTIEHGAADIRVGDVVIFRTARGLCAHLVVRAVIRDGQEHFLVKGNRCDAFDGLVPKDAILGKVVEVTGSNGHIRLDTLAWRIVCQVLATRSYAAGRCHAADSVFWRIVKSLAARRPSFLRLDPAAKAYLWRRICAISRAFSPARPGGRTDTGGVGA